jgi:hypothetical protein
LLDTVDIEVGECKRTSQGVLMRGSLFAIQRIIVYFNTRAAMQVQERERAERREFFRFKKWRDYKRVILESQKTREQRQRTFTMAVLKHLKIHEHVYYSSVRLIPYADVSKVQEEAMLKATMDWHEKVQKVEDERKAKESGEPYKPREGITLPVSKDKVLMADVQFQVKMAALHSSAGGAQKRQKDQSNLLIERFKIEDEINEHFGVEVEHFLILKKEDGELEEATKATLDGEDSEDVEETERQVKQAIDQIED